MSCFVTDQPCSLVERGCVDETAQYLLTLWARTKGKIENPNLFAGVAPHFVRFSGSVPANNSPEILFVGKQSLLGRSVKSARGMKIDRRELFDADHRKTIRNGFEGALWRPTLQLVQDTFATDDGPCKMTYERITLSWNAGKIPFLFSYSKLLDSSRLERQSHQEPDFGHLRLPPNSGQLTKVDHPTSTHSHRCW